MYGGNTAVNHPIPLVESGLHSGAVFCWRADRLMKRVLLVAYYFPPIAISGAMRPLGFCRYLEQYGWVPQILTTEVGSVYPPQPVDESLWDQVPPSVRVTRVGHANPSRNVIQIRNALRRTVQSVGRQGSGISGNEGGTCLPTQPTLFNQWMGTIIDCLWDRSVLFPDSQRYWLRPSVRLMSKLSRLDPPDVVVATGSPWTGLLVGRDLAKRFGVPFIADFRDP